eukprot:TRINITY_DN8853_c0_g1_i1.p1 TRINITY_DN8853_c0_g1~~TRINITY_DN8853_c0_g1_i1.p1  ORF type:complete len:294 (-),score=70.01 TRINITY_DN8853_c0_g1_i1:111-992(-)
MLFFIGLGLGDEKDITVRGLEAVRSCSYIFLEAYTSILGVDKEKLEAFYGKKILLADRDLVEQGAEQILEHAKDENVAFLVVGDPFGATTHTDLVIRARERDIEVQVIHNASIMNAIGVSGLQLYNFGQTVSIVFWSDSWRPDSFYDKIAQNSSLGLHTLCLLDIKVKEQSVENLARGRKIFEPPRYMTVNQCVEQLIETEANRKGGAFDPATTLCVGVSRVGQPTQKLIAGTMNELVDAEFGPPLHSFIIAGTTHDLERDYLARFAMTPEDKRVAAGEESEDSGGEGPDLFG